MIRHGTARRSRSAAALVLRGRIGGTGGMVGVDAARRGRAAVHDARRWRAACCATAASRGRDRPRPETLSRRAAARPRVVAARRAALVAAFVAFWVFDLVDEERRPRARRPVRAARRRSRTSSSSAVLGAALVPGPDPRRRERAAVRRGGRARSSRSRRRPQRGPRAAHRAPLGRRRVPDGLAARGCRRSPRSPSATAFAAVDRRSGSRRRCPTRRRRTCSASLGAARRGRSRSGTAIGAAPRAFSYTSIGASLDDPARRSRWPASRASC